MASLKFFKFGAQLFGLTPYCILLLTKGKERKDFLRSHMMGIRCLTSKDPAYPYEDITFKPVRPMILDFLTLTY